MTTLYDVLANAQHGEALDRISDQFGLTSQQTQAAVATLLPAISMGLKRSTTTPEGLGELLSLVGRQQDLYAMYDDPSVAFSRQGHAAGNAVLSNMFGSPDASRAIAGQAQQLSGGHCQTNLNGPAKGADLKRSGCKLTPLGQSGRTILFEDIAAVEVAVEVEVVVD